MRAEKVAKPRVEKELETMAFSFTPKLTSMLHCKSTDMTLTGSIASYIHFVHLLNFMETKKSWRVKMLNLKELKVLGFTNTPSPGKSIECSNAYK